MPFAASPREDTKDYPMVVTDVTYFPFACVEAKYLGSLLEVTTRVSKELWSIPWTFGRLRE